MIFFFIFLSAFARTTGDTFFDGNSGFSISKPADWEFVREKKSYGLQLKDGKMTAPEPGTIVTFAKSMGDKFFGVPPTVGVRHLNAVKPGADLTKWLEGELKSQATHDKYFVPASTAIMTTIDGKKGARAAYVNGTVIKGQEVRVYHVLYVVPAGGKVYLIHMNCNEGLSSQYLEVFSKIAGSIGTTLPE